MTKPLTDLKPANENPWYVLMTLSGEQEGNDIDEELHKQNARHWNNFSGANVGGSFQKKLQTRDLEFLHDGKNPVDVRDVIKREYQAQWIKRNSDRLEMPPMPGTSSDLDLSGTIFDKLFSGNNMFFERTVNFSGSKFRNDVLFIKCAFRKALDLSKVEILKNADFSDSLCGSDFVARDMKVLGTLMAKDVAIEGDFNLSNAQVAGTATLNNMQIEGRAMVVKGSFERGCIFDGSKFNGIANFTNAVFKGDIGFKSANFVNNTEFVSTHFHGDATFTSSIFEEEATFRNAVFGNRADFPRVQFKGITDFAESEFHTHGTDLMAGIRFTDAIFSRSTSFRQCRFAYSYPEFTNSDIYPVTDFSADEALWPRGITVPKKEARESCGIIRNLLAKKGLTEDQHFFFRREMLFTSHHEALLRRIPYQIYRCLSDYGHSIARPIGWLILVWIVGFAFLWAYFAGYQYLCFEDISAHVPRSTPKPEWDGWTAAGVSLSNLFPLFGFGRVFFKEVLETLPRALQFLSGFQTVISLPLIFFLGLSLRQRFRLR